MAYDANNPPPVSTEPGDPNWLLITAEIAAAQGYPESVIGQYIIDGRLPFPEQEI